MQKSIPMDDQKKATIWREWERGTPMADISRAIEKPSATVFSYLQYHGGIQPRRRIRRLCALSIEEREEISRGVVRGYSLRFMAGVLGRNPSTISREINKNGGRRRYRATTADKSAWKRAKRPKPHLLGQNSKLKELVAAKLREDWSPEQISGWLKLSYPDDEGLRVSHETIYKSLFIQTRGIFRKDLRNHLRSRRKFRHAKNTNLNFVPVPGHWGTLPLSMKGAPNGTTTEIHR